MAVRVPSQLHKMYSRSYTQSFPQKALQDQKRWMQRFLKKPRDMPVQEYISYMIEINNYLKELPPTIVGRNVTKLPGYELLD